MYRLHSSRVVIIMDALLWIIENVVTSEIDLTEVIPVDNQYLALLTKKNRKSSIRKLSPQFHAATG